MSAFGDLEDRITALEEARLTVADLPMAGLKRVLGETWTPSGDRFLLRGSVGQWALSSDVLAALGLSEETPQHGAGTLAKRRGASLIATEESRTDGAYGTLPTPDQVTDIVLPADGLIAVAYHALWKNSVVANGRAAIFLNGTELKANDGTSAPDHVPAFGADANVYAALSTYARGLVATSEINLTANETNVTTGQVVGTVGNTGSGAGGICWAYAAAGRYTVSVQFKSASGSVTVKERKLWVWTTGGF